MYHYCMFLTGSQINNIQWFFRDETSGEHLTACIEFFLDIPMHWRSKAITCVRTSSIIRRTTDAWKRGPGDAHYFCIPKA